MVKGCECGRLFPDGTRCDGTTNAVRHVRRMVDRFGFNRVHRAVVMARVDRHDSPGRSAATLLEGALGDVAAERIAAREEAFGKPYPNILLLV